MGRTCHELSWIHIRSYTLHYSPLPCDLFLSQAVYRRWKSRLNLLQSQVANQDENAQQQDEAADALTDLLDGIAQNQNNTLSGLMALLQQLNGNGPGDGETNESDNEEDAVEDDGVENMEDDQAEEGQDRSDDEDELLELLEDEDNSDSDDFLSVAEREPDENDSVVMEDVESAISKGQRAPDQPRTVSMSGDSMSSDDL